MSERKKIVIYHGGCFDGFTAAWIVRRFVDGWADAEFHPGKFGVDPPDCTGLDVLVVDFSYPRSQMLKVSEQAHSIRVLDHHASARERLEGLPFCTFDMERSGAGLTWDELVGGDRPWLVDVIEDRDLWRFRHGDRTRHAMARIASVPMDWANWDAFHAATWGDVAGQGQAIQDYIDRYGARAREQKTIEVIDGYEVPCINVPYMNCSDHVTALLEESPDAPFAAGYFRRGDGRWQFSLRSNGGEFDVSEVAARYGGGGHRGAAGFDVGSLPWLVPTPEADAS